MKDEPGQMGMFFYPLGNGIVPKVKSLFKEKGESRNSPAGHGHMQRHFRHWPKFDGRLRLYLCKDY